MPGCPKCGMQYLVTHACPPVTMATNTDPLFVQVPDRYAEGYQAGRIVALRQVGCEYRWPSGASCLVIITNKRYWCTVCRLLDEAEEE